MAGRAPGRAEGHVAASTPPGQGRGRRGGHRFAVVVARFNEPISLKLLEGARHAFASAGVVESAVEEYWVPGSFELPQAAAELARTGRYAAIVCVGVVIRGETPHFEHVAREAASGIREVGLTTGVPATFGVVTALDEAQAWARAGGAVGNRGAEAAEAAIEMAEFVAHVRSRRTGRGARQGSRRR